MTDLATGDIVSGLGPDEHVEIRQIKPLEAKTLIAGVTANLASQSRRT